MVTTSEPTPETGFIPTPLSENAVVVMERRIVARDEKGDPIETPDQCFVRVAHNLSQAELRYGGTEADRSAAEQDFYRLLSSLDFLPNSPTLVNAGRDLQQLSACFVLPVPDSIDGIFKAIRDTAVIHKSGGGTGFAFSRLRPANDRVRSTMGVASGPVSFMTVFDSATEAIKQGGTRRGANMGILRVDHPDIDLFIDMKADMTTLTNFNISVAVTDDFMTALAEDGDYNLISPKSGDIVETRNARKVWQTMVENAWQNGDPGVIFIDRINNGRANPVPERGPIESTNPCGEQPLYSYDSCNLGSLNLAHFVTGDPGSKAVDFERLGATVHRCVHLLDNVIEMNHYPIEEIEETSHAIRRIGLGVMGWADMLLDLRIPYDSEEALSLAREVMGFIQREADNASHNLAAVRGNFPDWGDSLYGPGGDEGPMPLRNSTRTTIAPTGTLSIIADCSGGVEPVFALAFVRSHYLDKDDPTKRVELNEVNEHFEHVARNEGFYSDDLIEFLAKGGHLAERNDVPDWVKDVFVTAHDIAPEAHVRMQAAFQEHTDNAVSKTINFPNEATVEDVATAYQLAYETGCKGITIYRDGSRDLQVLKHAGEGESGMENEEAAADAIAAAEALVAKTGRSVRRRLPDERQSLTHKFRVGELEGYMTVGLFEDGTPGELFVNVSRQGSTVMALMDTMAMLTSYALQFGVPVSVLARKLQGSRFEPSGPTGNQEIPIATSIIDYIFRWLDLKFGDREAGAQPTLIPPYEVAESMGVDEPALAHSNMVQSGVGCPDCGSVLYYGEGCLICRSCGYNKCG
ncbi:MAG: ribonucleoside-diphosphate reductase, adenosylcobalamin-dependent [Dehalococcoidia bacterium]|nr:ribonucleoside-diphosphate reductase, adenosylcobalamin-dependent [Dehalococcoidia bacterium]|tara:strand:+ start:2585 stop:4996 length:2412 start_codon:yes stop_codon:yes gene_type:complete